MATSTARVALFGSYAVDVRSGELRKHGTRIKLGEQPLRILLMLLERPGELVTREELRARLWAEDTFVDFEHSLNSAVQRLRDCLSDAAGKPRWVETVPRRGYRFIGQVQWPAETVSLAGHPSPGELATPAVSEPAPEPVPARWVVGRFRWIAQARLEPAEKTFPSRWTIVAAIGLVILGVAAVAWWFLSHPTHTLTEKDTVVLADFINTTGDAIFDDTLKQALAAVLAQSPFLNILSDQRISETLRMMESSPGEPITPNMAREICQRTGSAAVLAGSIANLGSQYVIGLNATNCATGDYLAREEVQAARKEEVLNALGQAARGIREKLGESLASIQKFDTPVYQATTSSLEALKAYSLAASSGGVTPYTSLLQHAIELDPKFAVAYMGLSTYYDGAEEAELASEYAQKAFDNREHATEPERLLITSNYYYAVLGDLDRELAIEHVLHQMYPRDWGPWNDSASSRLLIGDYTRALQEGQEALRLNPLQSESYLTPGRALLALGLREEVKQIAQRAQARGMDVPAVHILVYDVAFLENDRKEMEAQLAPLLAKQDKGTFQALVTQSNTDAYFGRLRNSLGILERGIEITRRGKYYELAAQVRDAEALRQAEFGNYGEARQAALTALTLSSGRNAKLFTALALARSGEMTRAQALADELSSQFPSHALMQRYWLPAIRASIELARKNPAKAVDDLKSVAYELGDNLSLAGNLYPAYVRGQAYLRMHQGKEAAVEFQKFLDYRCIVSNSALGALARLGLARAYALQGDTAQARTAYQDFLALWKDADPNIPILKQARAEYVKLEQSLHFSSS